MNTIYARQPVPSGTETSIFLMGPTPREGIGGGKEIPSWRPEALRLLAEDGYNGIVYVPEDESGQWRANYDDQIEWEDAALAQATMILAWIPRDLDTLPGLTTNTEWGKWENSGKIVLGYPHEAVKMRYIQFYADKLMIPVAHTLEDTCKLAHLGVRTQPRSGCVFCEVIANDPHNQIEEVLKDSIVITPYGPVTDGHKLVIPKIHVTHAGYHPEIAGRVMRDAAEYAARECYEFNIITSAGFNATQTINHLHVHVIPREENDGLLVPWGHAPHQNRWNPDGTRPNA